MEPNPPNPDDYIAGAHLDAERRLDALIEALANAATLAAVRQAAADARRRP